MQEHMLTGGDCQHADCCNAIRCCDAVQSSNYWPLNPVLYKSAKLLMTLLALCTVLSVWVAKIVVLEQPTSPESGGNPITASVVDLPSLCCNTSARPRARMQPAYGADVKLQ